MTITIIWLSISIVIIEILYKIFPILNTYVKKYFIAESLMVVVVFIWMANWITIVLFNVILLLTIWIIIKRSIEDKINPQKYLIWSKLGIYLCLISLVAATEPTLVKINDILFTSLKAETISFNTNYKDITFFRINNVSTNQLGEVEELWHLDENGKLGDIIAFIFYYRNSSRILAKNVRISIEPKDVYENKLLLMGKLKSDNWDHELKGYTILYLDQNNLELKYLSNEWYIEHQNVISKKIEEIKAIDGRIEFSLGDLKPDYNRSNQALPSFDKEGYLVVYFKIVGNTIDGK